MVLQCLPIALVVVAIAAVVFMSTTAVSPIDISPNSSSIIPIVSADPVCRGKGGTTLKELPDKPYDVGGKGRTKTLGEAQDEVNRFAEKNEGAYGLFVPTSRLKDNQEKPLDYYAIDRDGDGLSDCVVVDYQYYKVIPKWSNVGKLNKCIQDEWSRFVGFPTRHEQKHRDIFVKHFTNVHERLLNKSPLDMEIEWNKIMTAYEGEDATFHFQDYVERKGRGDASMKINKCGDTKKTDTEKSGCIPRQQPSETTEDNNALAAANQVPRVTLSSFATSSEGIECNTPVANPSYIRDPSGYVYEAVPSNRLENVTATVIVKDETNGNWSEWKAQDFGQTNPQMTDSEGRYGWDVPDGEWQVIYEKPGYHDAKSELIHVPPPKTDANIGMVSLEPPEVVAVSAVAETAANNGDGGGSNNNNSSDTTENNSNNTANSINIQFDKYVFVNNLTNSTISVFNNSSEGALGEEEQTLDNNNNQIAGEVVAVNPVNSPEGIPLTRQASFIPLRESLIANETYNVYVSREIQSYAGVPISNDYHEVVTVMPEPNYSLAINSSVTFADSISNQTMPLPTPAIMTTIPLGSSVNAISTTNDRMSSKTTFTLYDPDNLEIARETIAASPFQGVAHSPEFTPTNTGIWRIQALFTDGNNIFESRSVSFNVTEMEEEVLVTSPKPTISNTPPIANAGADQQGQEDTMVVLNGTVSSDPDSSIADNSENLTFSWLQKEDNIGNSTTARVDLVGGNTSTPIFIAPTINNDDLAASPTTLTFELRVTDEHNSTSVDTVNVTIHDSSKTEVKAVEKTDPIGINVAGSNNDTEEDEGGTPAATTTTTNATTVTTEVTGFGSTSTEESIVPMDIVFAIDSSNSMQDNDPDNLRLEAAKSFLDKLNQTRDRAGVVNWDSQIEGTFGLTSDYDSLKTNIDQTTLGSGTNLDEGLRGAIGMLDSSNNSTEVVGSARNESSSSKAIVFLTDGVGEYTPSSAVSTTSPSNLTESTTPIVDVAKVKGYRIFSIGLNIEPGSDAEANLIDMASATGGQYFSSPTAENLAEVFNAIHQTVVRVSNTAPQNVDVIEVTEDYIEGETNFSIQPTSINETSNGRTMITWLNISQHVGNKDDKLTADETFVVTFTAGASKAGNALPVNSAEESVVTYVDALGNQKRVQVSQAYINVVGMSSNTGGAANLTTR